MKKNALAKVFHLKTIITQFFHFLRILSHNFVKSTGGYLDYAWDWTPGSTKTFDFRYFELFTISVGVWRGGKPVPLQNRAAASVPTYTYSNQLSFLLLSQWVYDRFVDPKDENSA